MLKSRNLYRQLQNTSSALQRPKLIAYAHKTARSESKATPLPGYGLPLDYIPGQEALSPAGNLFPNALDPEMSPQCLPMLTLREFSMLHLMNSITDKPGWENKVFDERITAKWKNEAIANRDPKFIFTPKMADWCIEELKYKSQLFKTNGFISIYNGDVVKSDTIVPELLKTALQNAVAPVENIPAQDRDWHPGSWEKVLDLVHPSLFPLIYGRSRILKSGRTTLTDFTSFGHETEIIQLPQSDMLRLRNSRLYSTKFQWLPCEVDISEETAKITSYINNLHPERHADLYNVINQMITLAIPMWNASLTPSLTQTKGLYPLTTRIAYDRCDYSPHDVEDGEELSKRRHNEDLEAYELRKAAWIRLSTPFILPEPGEFSPPPKLRAMDLQKQFKSLQVIVKLANIELTPDKPEYVGGSWHVEGQLNERICATAIYYYSCSNITTSQIAFRQQVDDMVDVDYVQESREWLEGVFGIEEGPAVQDIGGINTTEGRMITFTNILQHQVQPFRLADPTKPGHRKILALFLVDPNTKVISTENVPCQQESWWYDGIEFQQSPLPLKVKDHNIDESDYIPVSMRGAKAFRLELMKERKSFALENQDAFKAHTISLCEH